jgi:predicted TIM-barrel fold metal-dependent hydrolase
LINNKMVLEDQLVKRYMEQIRELKKSNRFYDCHVHPFDVILNHADHPLNQVKEGIYSVDYNEYKPPVLTAISVSSGVVEGEIQDSDMLEKLMIMQSKKLYKHIGPGVLLANMNLSEIDTVLLLPVAPREGDLIIQMHKMVELFGNHNRFKICGSVPNQIDNHDINEYIKMMVKKYNMKAVKLHPIISGIDLSTRFGKKRVENILTACAESALPLIVHGGRSFLFRNKPVAFYSLIEHLENINWGISNQNVVIAHAAAYDCELSDIENIIIPKLSKMLNHNNKLLVDISALGFNALTMIINNIDSDRIIFGSDALYYPQWISMIKLYHVLTKNTSHIEENFLKIMSFNPARTVFKDCT